MTEKASGTTTPSASRTAAMVAALRARLTAKGELIDDPFAAKLCGEDGFALADQICLHFPPMELWIGLRTAYLDRLIRRFVVTDDWTARATSSMPAQVVILGAGYDARAARLAELPAKFYEVDRPQSQESKLRRLREVGYPVGRAQYVPCDFESDDFLDGLVSAGFDVDRPVLFIWEGVTPYLSEQAIVATTTRIASGCAQQAVLAFDYVGKKLMATRGDGLDPAGDATKQMVGDLGEPVTFGTNDPLPLLYSSGFRHVESHNFDALALALTQTYERDRMFRFQHIAVTSRLAPKWLA